jgi:hypothetical protein
VHDILTHPGYAGVFSYGRTRTEKYLGTDGKVASRQRRLPRQEWRVMIPDHHPGYISMDTFEANIAALAANKPVPAGDGGGAAREGRAWFQGLMRCGRCGRLMQVNYRHGVPAYRCGRAQQMYGAKTCQQVAGRRLEEPVLQAVFAALEPAALAATVQALQDAQARYRQHLAVFERAAERARFEAGRARRQYDNVEPENRLVARTLETALEARLNAARIAGSQLAAQQARRPVTLTEQEAAWITTAGADLRAVFHAPTTTNVQRKQLLRAVIAEIVITVSPAGGSGKRTAGLRIIWQGGASTELTVPLARTGQHSRVTSEDTLDLVRRLAVHYNDATIAQILGQQGRRTATGLTWTKTHISQLRAYHRIPGYQPAAPNVIPGRDDALVVTIAQAGHELGVSTATLYRWLREGFLIGEQLTPGAPWRIRIDQQLRDRITAQAPAGWVTLAAAAKILGIARQTVLHKVQRGELNAIQVTQGRRQGLRIQVEHSQPGLFDKPS